MAAERFPPLRLVPLQEGTDRVYDAQLDPNPRVGKEVPRGLRNLVVDLEALKRTLEFLRENHGEYYVLYRLMLESGLRFEHALSAINLQP